MKLKAGRAWAIKESLRHFGNADILKTLRKCMKKDLFSCIHYYEYDIALWRSIRATNILERAFRKVRRRTKPMNNFLTNEQSANRIMFGISEMLNHNWKV